MLTKKYAFMFIFFTLILTFTTPRIYWYIFSFATTSQKGRYGGERGRLDAAPGAPFAERRIHQYENQEDSVV
jgi:hypothetical protein